MLFWFIQVIKIFFSLVLNFGRKFGTNIDKKIIKLICNILRSFIISPMSFLNEDGFGEQVLLVIITDMEL